MKQPFPLPPGVISDVTKLAASGRWADGSNVRFVDGLPEVIGGWESVISDLLTGVCRAVFQWTDKAASLNIGFGTHSKLQVWVGGLLADVTPTLALPPATLRGPLTCVSGSAVVTVAHAGHGYKDGETVAISGARPVCGLTLAGDYVITVVDDDSYTVTASSTANQSRALGVKPLSVTNGSVVVTVADPAHGLQNGDSITVSGASTLGGITPNGTFEVTVVDGDSYTYEFDTAADSTATGGGSAVALTLPLTGGGVALVVTPSRAYEEGQIDGTGGSGYGTGAWDVGAFGSPSTTDYFPRTWALDAWGENLMACPRNGTLYLWENDTGTVAAPVKNAPRKIKHALVSHTDQMFALGCNEEVSGVFNPLCIRYSSVRNATEWSTTASSTAREEVLPGGGEIVAGRRMGNYLLVWTTNSLFLGTFTGTLAKPWTFTRVGDHCGLCGPNAAVVVGMRAFWLSPDLTYRSYSLGGEVVPMDCPIRKDMANNISAAQLDKVVASSVATFNEVRFDYPDARDGFENSRYQAVNIRTGAWFKGQMARTAMVDAGPGENPVGVTYEGAIYWHERGQSADGAVLDWFIETAELGIDANVVALLRGLWPDISDQVGPWNLTVHARLQIRDGETRLGPFAISPTTERTDFLATGRLFRFRWEGAASPTGGRLGSPIFDLGQAGLR